MSSSGSIIYGLEYQARALTTQQGESTEIKFFVGTNTLKPNNQVHAIVIDEEQQTASATVFPHPYGAIWKLNSSPKHPQIIASVYNTQTGSNQVSMKTAVLTMPEDVDPLENPAFTNAEVLKVESDEIKTTEFHHSDERTLATVTDHQILLSNLTESSVKTVAEVNNKNQPKFTTGKWCLHHQGNQFIVLSDTTIRSYDVRDFNQSAWTIDNGHSQLIRDLDCNNNKQATIVTASDDGCIKIWDFRNTKEAVFSCHEHSHWIWSVRFNKFHDQLLLSCSSDCKVNLISAFSVSSESTNYRESEQPPGLLESWSLHEDSVYGTEWSSADPFVFCSLAYDGRVIIQTVPKNIKYDVLL